MLWEKNPPNPAAVRGFLSNSGPISLEWQFFALPWSCHRQLWQTLNVSCVPQSIKMELLNGCSQALWDLMSSDRSPTGFLLSPVWHRNHSPCLCTGSGARALGSGHSRESLPDAATGSRWGHGPWLWPKSVEAINEDRHWDCTLYTGLCTVFGVLGVLSALGMV